MPPGDRSEVSGRDAAPRAYDASSDAGEYGESAGRRPHRLAHGRQVVRLHRDRSDRHRVRQTRRQETHRRDADRRDARSHRARLTSGVEEAGLENVGGTDRRTPVRSGGAVGRTRPGGRHDRSAPGYATGGSDVGVVAEARRWLGGNPTNRRSLWCGAFMNFVLERTGHQGTGSDLARSFASLGHRVSGPQVGAIAVMARRGGGHVGIVSGVDGSGNPIIISGNHGRRVAESTYPRGRVYAYVMP